MHNADCSSPSELSCHMVDGNMYEIPRLVRCKNREKYMPKKKKSHTRQYLHDSAICLRPRSYRDFTILREKYRVRHYNFSSKKRH